MLKLQLSIACINYFLNIKSYKNDTFEAEKSRIRIMIQVLQEALSFKCNKKFFHLLQVHLSHKSTIKIPRIFENSTSEMIALNSDNSLHL